MREAQGESASIRRTICDNLCKLIDSDHEHRKIVLALIGGEVTIPKDFPALFEQLAATMDRITDNTSKPCIRTTDSQGNTRLFPTIQAVGMALEDVDAFCPRGYLCDAGMHNLWINAFGDVYRCPTLGGAMHLGSILDGGYRRLEKPESCASDHCSCSQFGVICKPGT